MNIYKEPAFQSELVSQGFLGESCSIVDNSNNWTKIKQWDNYEGWAHNFYGLTQDEPYTATHLFLNKSGAIVDSNGLGIRSIHFGSQLKASYNDNNYTVNLPDGIEGVCTSELNAETLSSTRESVVLLAKSFLGIPYLWGGKSSLGFDCSGFVQTVFKAHGIELPRDSHQQADQYLNEIALKESQPGDLLFFAEQSKISHVAISLGGEDLINVRGWVRLESLQPSSSIFSQTLRDQFIRAASISEVVNS